MCGGGGGGGRRVLYNKEKRVFFIYLKENFCYHSVTRKKDVISSVAEPKCFICVPPPTFPRYFLSSNYVVPVPVTFKNSRNIQ